MAQLANESVFHPRYLGYNLRTDRKYFQILFVSHLNPNVRVLFVNLYILDPRLPKTINHILYVDRKHLKMLF
jgi:hypothetical protein